MKKLKKILPTLLLVLGLIFAGSSYYGYRLLLSNGDNAKHMTHRIQPNKNSQQRIIEKNKQANFYPNQIKPVTPSDYAAAQLKYEEIVNQWGIGSVYIPSANLQTKILAGMANENLMVAAGTYYPDQKLGKGNYVLLSHNLVEGGGPLGTLPNTKIGHTIYATDFSDVYEYTATKNSTVDQTEGDLLDIPSNEDAPIITLFRCEGGLNTPSRSLVQGKFSKKYPANLATDNVKLGLGLGVMKESDRNNNSSAEEETSNKDFSKQKPTKKSTDATEFEQGSPTYSFHEKIAIECFKTINKYPLQISIGFLGLLLIFIRISK